MNSEIYTQGWNDGCADCDAIAASASASDADHARIKAKYDAASTADANEQADDYTHGYAQGFDTRADVLTHEAHTAEAIAQSGRAAILDALIAEGERRAEAQEEREAKEAAERAAECAKRAAASDDAPGEAEEDSDDEPDEAHKQRTIRVVVFEPGELPQVREMTNELSAMQGIVGGLIECFPVGVEGLIGICNDEFLFQGLPMNRYIPATRSIICGTFFVAKDCAPNFCSMSAGDIARLLRVIA